VTNLTASGRRQWITRARVLMGLPIALGLIISLPLLLVAVRPAWKDVTELQRRRDGLLQLQRNLPAVEAQLETETASLEQAEQQQALLIGLLAGRDKVQTFLALLNQQARLSGVAIRRYEPIQASPPSSAKPKSSRSTSKSQKTEDEAAAEDPLLALGYRKSSVALSVRGPYAGLQTFLRRMESLDLLVESSELEIKAAAKPKDEQDLRGLESRTQLTLKLSFYDMAQEAHGNSDNSKTNSAP